MRGVCVCVWSAACIWCVNCNLTVPDSAIPNHIRPGLGSGPRPDEKRHLRACERSGGGQERAAGGSGVPQEPAEVHRPGRKAP